MNNAETIRAIIDKEHTYIGDAPIETDECQWIRLSAGDPQTFFGRDVYELTHFMLFARGKSNKEVEQRTYQMYHALHCFVGTRFSIVVTRLPHFVGRDDKDRAVYAFSIEYQALPQLGGQ